MMRRVVFLFFRLTALILVLQLTFLPSAFAQHSGADVSATSAIFSNSTAVKRYFGKNVHKRVLPASTTKVMTALLVLENLPLDKVVTVSSKAAAAQPTNISMRTGEKFRVRDLLYAILLKSANDASIVLAEAVAGSEWQFVQMMNRRAKEIGARDTRFANSNGLPTKSTRQYTTAYDMYLIFREAIKNDFFREAIKVSEKSISSLGGRRVYLKSHNKLLSSGWRQRFYGKTGYTRAAKSCFVGYTMKGNDICIIAVFGCTRRWEDIKHIAQKYGGILL